MQNNLTRQQAKEALDAGHKVVHALFIDGEWVKKLNDTTYVFEDTVEQSIQEFWDARKTDLWDNDWSTL